MEAVPLYCVCAMLCIYFFPFVYVTSGGQADATVHNVGYKLCHRIKAPFSIYMFWNIFNKTVPK